MSAVESFVALDSSVDLPDGRMLAFGEQAAVDPEDEHIARHIEAGRLGPAPDPKPATDAARRKAEELDVDIELLDGSGKDGNVTVEDVEKAAAAQEESSSEAAEKNSDDEEEQQ